MTAFSVICSCVFSSALVAGLIVHFYREQTDGNRKSNKARADRAGSSSPNYAQLYAHPTAATRAGAGISPPTGTSAGTGLGMPHISLGQITAITVSSGSGYLSMPMMMHSGVCGGSLALMQANSLVKRCDDCGLSYKSDIEHTCAKYDDVDLAAVKSIQMLASAGMSPQEIADDMKIKLGYRVYSMTPEGVAGAGTGNAQVWPMDKPIIAVCVAHCSPDAKEICAKSARPYCRILAIKNQDYGNVPVALWGDVIECEAGWLASCAYPLGFESAMLAKAYGVCHIKEDKMSYDLDRINAERRRRGQAPLSRAEASSAVETRRNDPGFDVGQFLLGYATGIPMGSGESIIGAMMHPNTSYSPPDSSPSYSPSSDSGNSSPSYDSGGSSDNGGGGGDGS